MSRKCSTCQHVKRAEIDRRLAAGEPGSEIAKDYGINPSSLHGTVQIVSSLPHRARS